MCLTGLRPHKCTDCDKAFTSRDSLNKHVLSHQDDRNFKCGKCGKLFKRLGHVREHVRIHSEARPFNCTVCTKTFKTNVSAFSSVIVFCGTIILCLISCKWV